MKWPEEGSIWRDPIALFWLAIAALSLVWSFVGAARWLFG